VEPRYFETAAEWREWLEANHSGESELLVGMHKSGSGRRSMTWPESVDEALCFGWIDGVRRSLGEAGYTIRFCVRKEGSIWSRVNVAKAQALIEAGRMKPAGRGKFEARQAGRSGVYSFEQKSVDLDAESKAKFMARAKAWRFFQKQAPSYRKKIIWWIGSAKRAATRDRRLAKAIDVFSRNEMML
jgi:uncharacterized protein YdeI (YjbR/CyaY-like superfamily)